MEESTQKVPAPKKSGWKAHLKAAIPALVLLIAFFAYRFGTNAVEKAAESDMTIPVLETPTDAETPPAVDAGNDIDPENPPPLQPGPERQKFDAENQKLLNESKLSLEEVKRMHLTNEERSTAESFAAKYSEDDGSASLTRNEAFLRSQIQSTQEQAAYYVGAVELTNQKFSSPMKALVSIYEDNSDADAPDSAAPKKACWKLRLTFPKELSGTVHSRETSSCGGEGFYADKNGKNYLVIDPNAEGVNPLFHVFVFEFPSVGATQKVEAQRAQDNSWDSGTVTWSKVSQSEFLKY